MRGSLDLGRLAVECQVFLASVPCLVNPPRSLGFEGRWWLPKDPAPIQRVLLQPILQGKQNEEKGVCGRVVSGTQLLAPGPYSLKMLNVAQEGVVVLKPWGDLKGVTGGQSRA